MSCVLNCSVELSLSYFRFGYSLSVLYSSDKALQVSTKLVNVDKYLGSFI